MPWRESSPMSDRLRFVQACLDRRTQLVDVCTAFGISEKTGHKWLARFRADGPAGLAERSHAPHQPCGAMPAAVADRIVALKRRFPLSGPRKLRDWLDQHEPERVWPAVSTIGELLKRTGLVCARRRRVRGPRHAQLPGRTLALAPNDVWTADFKGEFRLRGSTTYCYPLTILDLHSHWLLRCTALPSTAVAATRRSFERLFREYGLPTVLRTDNGIPFAQPNAMGRMGALAFWWARLGIRPEHTTPARPAENGAHERFHRTLKAHTIHPPAASFAAQQQRFTQFQQEYNTERPHESLPGHRPPASVYTASLRPYPARLPALEYPDATATRRVDCIGFFKWHQHRVFLSRNLAGADIGLYEQVDDHFTIRYAALELGIYAPHTHRFTTHVHWTG